MERRTGHRAFLVLACAAALFGACGGESEAERAAHAAKELSVAREELTRAREDLASKQAAAQAASAAVDAARERVSQAETRVQTAESSADLRVSDAALFRAVQERLLADRGLRDVAIRAQVTQGTVVLSGKVPNEKARERALSVARETAGVVAVDSQIEVVPKQ